MYHVEWQTGGPELLWFSWIRKLGDLSCVSSTAECPSPWVPSYQRYFISIPGRVVGASFENMVEQSHEKAHAQVRKVVGGTCWPGLVCPHLAEEDSVSHSPLSTWLGLKSSVRHISECIFERSKEVETIKWRPTLNVGKSILGLVAQTKSKGKKKRVKGVLVFSLLCFLVCWYELWHAFLAVMNFIYSDHEFK